MRNGSNETKTLAALASRQYGLLSHGQAIAAGLSRMAISRRVGAGTWRVVHPRVFSTSPSVESLEQRALAACLWLGNRAVISHRTAALLLGIKVDWPTSAAEGQHSRSAPVIEVTCGRGDCGGVTGLVVHRSTGLSADDQRTRRSIPVTSGARTLIDLASCLDEERLAYVVDEAWRRQLAAPDWVSHRLLGFAQGRRGTKALARVLADCSRRGAPLESALEVRLWRLLCRAKLPLPEPGYPFRDDHGPPGRIDFAYPEHGLALEADGFEFHSDRATFEKDRVRNARLAAQGWRVLPVTWRQLDEQPIRVLARIRQALEHRTQGPSSDGFD
jgi:very-short-patch-repair endonuclease